MATKKTTNPFYSLDGVLKTNAQYNIIIGERSNGKTYACLKRGIEEYAKGNGQMAIVRRWADDFKGKRGATMFDALVANNEVYTATQGRYNNVYYYAGRWYFCNYDDDGKRMSAPEPFAYAFSLSAMEHDKSTSYPLITTIVFDEFLTRGMYLPDEFILFCNVVSTIVRHRDNVKIFLLGNTVNKYCPYFKEFGLKNIDKLKQGAIDTYKYGDSGLKVSVEYCSPVNKEGKPSDVYFAFDNPKLKMITGGEWELEIYPHCPVKYYPTDIVLKYFIEFDEKTLQCEIIQKDEMTFTFIHVKSTDIKEPDTDIIYSPRYDPRPNWKRRITHPQTKIERFILSFFNKEKVFYQDNDTGELVQNYIKWCLNSGK